MTQETAKLKQTLDQLIEVIMNPSLYKFLTDSEQAKIKAIIDQSNSHETHKS